MPYPESSGQLPNLLLGHFPLVNQVDLVGAQYHRIGISVPAKNNNTRIYCISFTQYVPHQNGTTSCGTINLPCFLLCCYHHLPQASFIICLSWQYIYSCVGVPLCACMHLEQSLWTFCAVEITLEFNYCCYELSTDFCDSVSKMRTQVHSSMADFIVSLDGMALL